MWEMAQLPFYGPWRDGTPGAITFAILHCTTGDVLIAMTSVLIALLITGRSSWPTGGAARTSLVATTIGVTYTVFSGWLNASVRGAGPMPLPCQCCLLLAPASSRFCNG